MAIVVNSKSKFLSVLPDLWLVLISCFSKNAQLSWYRAVSSNIFSAPHLGSEELIKNGKVFGDVCKTSTHKIVQCARVGQCSHDITSSW